MEIRRLKINLRFCGIDVLAQYDWGLLCPHVLYHLMHLIQYAKTSVVQHHAGQRAHNSNPIPNIIRTSNPHFSHAPINALLSRLNAQFSVASRIAL
jgi:hypothetical protein